MILKLITYTLYIILLNAIGTKDNQYQNLDRLAHSIENNHVLKHGQWSVYATYVENGNVIVDLNSNKSLAPASNMKLVTSAVALALLGEEKTFNTTLEYTGTITEKGVLKGNLIIRGKGDPTLGSSEMEGVPDLHALYQTWVSAIENAGIRQIDGDIVGDDSYLDYMPLPPDWYWRDIGNYYAASTSGLCINENLYRLFFRPSKKVGGPAIVIKTEPDVPGLTFLNHMKTGKVGSGDNGFIYAAPWQYLHQLEGTIPAGVKEFSIKGALPDPAKFAAQYLHNQLSHAGISVSGKAITIRESAIKSPERTTLYTIKSPPLKDIIYRLNKRSVNIYAEQLLKNIGQEIKGKGTLSDAINLVEEWLEDKNIYIDGLNLHDGSGLSRANTATTRFFVELLNTIYRETFFDSYYNSLAIAGDPNDDSYMTNMCKGSRAAKNLRAKTGSINHIRAHSGYVHTRSGKLVSFSMIANEYIGRMRNVDKLHEKMMIQLAELP